MAFQWVEYLNIVEKKNVRELHIEHESEQGISAMRVFVAVFPCSHGWNYHNLFIVLVGLFLKIVESQN